MPVIESYSHSAPGRPADARADSPVSCRGVPRAPLLAAAGLVLLFAGAGCRDNQVDLEPPVSVRPVRVLLADGVDAIRVRVDGAYELRKNGTGTFSRTSGTSEGTAGDPKSEPVPLLQANVHNGTDLAWSRIDASLTIDGTSFAPGPLELRTHPHGTIHFDRTAGANDSDAQYAGTLVIYAEEGVLRVVNLVDIETYVATVVSHECWPGFKEESLKAQSVAARTYALYQMSQRADWSYDVQATEGDQVYAGLRFDRTGRRAAAATDATRGVVLACDTDDGLRIFCAFYSAACGGMTQSVAAIRPGDPPLPLRGGVRCDYCKIAPGEQYRWGPTKITKAELLENLHTREPATADWQAINSVHVVEKTAGGRIASVRITGASNDKSNEITLVGERFRLDVGSRRMRSTACDLVDAGDVVRFENGKGFGHGVGLCQWGMEGQARLRHRAADILLYYYPGAKLVRAY